MTGALMNHLWQSTLVAVALGLLTLLFRKDRADVRYWLWFGASCKFLVPFSLLIDSGRRIEWLPAAKVIAAPSASLRMAQFTQPFPPASTSLLHAPEHAFASIPLVTLAIWACGIGLIAFMRLRGWQRIRAAVKSSVAVDLPAAVETRSSAGLLEPGVVGLFHPILLLPAGLAKRLTAPQLEAVLAHENCHVRRRDNLTSAIHMLVEAIFWFHPLIWWVGGRLVEERERACDEAVLRLGIESHEYAQGILEICKSYLESPLSCVSGVTGSDLKKRIYTILSGRVPGDLTSSKKFALAAAAIVLVSVPVLIGMAGAPRRAQSPVPVVTATFESASIRSCTAFRNTRGSSPGMLVSQCTTVQRLIQQAYGLFAIGHADLGSFITVAGGPDWAATDLYAIEAKAPGPESRAILNGPMLQALLEERFKLKLHHERRDIPAYILTVAAGGPHLEPFRGTCTSRDFDDPPSDADCATGRGYGNTIHLGAVTIEDLCASLLVFLNRPVVDQTGIAGRFNLTLDFSPEDPQLLNRPRALPALSNPRVSPPPPIRFEAASNAMKSLGLNLEPAQAPGDFLVMDAIERPSAN